jgi:hypothetical protein
MLHCTVWLCIEYGLTSLAGVSLSVSLDIGALYPKMIWGGLWGLLFALTVVHHRTRKHWVRKGLVISLAPTLYQLFVVFPHQTPYGSLGAELGLLTPLFILLFNLVWGIFTGIFARLLWGKA